MDPGEEKLRVFQVQDNVTGIRAGAIVVKDRKMGSRGRGVR